MPGRIAPARQPFAPWLQETFERVMRGAPPLTLFATIARDERLAARFFASNLLDRGHVTLREREIVINRTSARCGSEYEWGVHVARFAAKAGLTEAQIESLASGTSADPCWSASETTLLEFCDALHERATLDDDLWSRLTSLHTDETLLELIMLAGYYRMVSYLTNALRLPLEPFAARFPQRSVQST